MAALLLGFVAGMIGGALGGIGLILFLAWRAFSGYRNLFGDWN